MGKACCKLILTHSRKMPLVEMAPALVKACHKLSLDCMISSPNDPVRNLRPRGRARMHQHISAIPLTRHHLRSLLRLLARPSAHLRP